MRGAADDPADDRWWIPAADSAIGYAEDLRPALDRFEGCAKEIATMGLGRTAL